MATQTFNHSIFDGGAVAVEFDINTANWRMSAIRCINNSDQPAHAWIYDGASLVFEATAPANATTSWNTSGIQMGWDTVDGGLMMGSYRMLARYPYRGS